MNKIFFAFCVKKYFLKFLIFRLFYSSVCCVISLNTFRNNSSNLNAHFFYSTFISKSYYWNRWCIFRPTHIRSTLLLTSSHVVLQQHPTTYPVLVAWLSSEIDLTWPNLKSKQWSQPLLMKIHLEREIVAEFKEFERRFKFKPRLKFGWFKSNVIRFKPALNLNRVLADLNRGSNSLNSISGNIIYSCF